MALLIDAHPSNILSFLAAEPDTLWPVQVAGTALFDQLEVLTTLAKVSQSLQGHEQIVRQHLAAGSPVPGQPLQRIVRTLPFAGSCRVPFLDVLPFLGPQDLHSPLVRSAMATGTVTVWDVIQSAVEPMFPEHAETGRRLHPDCTAMQAARLLGALLEMAANGTRWQVLGLAVELQASWHYLASAASPLAAMRATSRAGHAAVPRLVRLLSHQELAELIRTIRSMPPMVAIHSAELVPAAYDLLVTLSALPAMDKHSLVTWRLDMHCVYLKAECIRWQLSQYQPPMEAPHLLIPRDHIEIMVIRLREALFRPLQNFDLSLVMDPPLSPAQGIPVPGSLLGLLGAAQQMFHTLREHGAKQTRQSGQKDVLRSSYALAAQVWILLEAVLFDAHWPRLAVQRYSEGRPRRHHVSVIQPVLTNHDMVDQRHTVLSSPMLSGLLHGVLPDGLRPMPLHDYCDPRVMYWRSFNRSAAADIAQYIHGNTLQLPPVQLQIGPLSASLFSRMEPVGLVLAGLRPTRNGLDKLLLLRQAHQVMLVYPIDRDLPAPDIGTSRHGGFPRSH